MAALLCALSACGSSNSPSGSTLPPPDAGTPDDSFVATDSTVVMDAATGPDAEAGVEAGDAAIEVGPPVCSPTATWGPGTLLSISTADLDRFGAITPDELTIAWMTPSDAGTTGTVYTADRDTVSAPFGTASALPSALGYFALGAVALSPDGLTLVVVRADGQGFGAASRASRPGTFGPPDETAFNQIDLNHADMPDPGIVLADPVVAQDGTSLFFTETSATTVNPIVSVDLVGGIWTHLGIVTGDSLAASAGKLRRPTGLASDRRTLFFYDEVSSIERAAWRDSAGGQFSTFADIGALMGAQPNRACTRLYTRRKGPRPWTFSTPTPTDPLRASAAAPGTRQGACFAQRSCSPRSRSRSCRRRPRRPRISTSRCTRCPRSTPASTGPCSR